MAWQGGARLGMARHGWARHGTRLGMARRGGAGRGMEHGVARRGAAWQGKEHGLNCKKIKIGVLKMSKQFFGGVPTDIEVKQLSEKFGVPVAGQVIKYQEISDAIGVQRVDGRWQSVVSAWRKKLERENNIIMKAIDNIGFEALNAAGRVELSAKVFKQAVRRTGRAANIAAQTNRAELNEDQKRVCDHIQNTGAALRLAAAQASRQIKWDDDEKKS